MRVNGKVRFLIFFEKLTMTRISPGNTYLYLTGGAHLNLS